MLNFFPVNKLRDRYEIGKQADINRRKHLGIIPAKVNGSFFVTKDELDKMDLLHEFLKAPGAKMADFRVPETKEGEIIPVPMEAKIIPQTGSNEKIDRDHPSDWLIHIEAIARAIQPPNPISHWEKLRWAAQTGVVLTTKEISQLLGTMPKLKSGQTIWRRGSFNFEKVGKIGSSSAWLVTQTKIESNKQSGEAVDLSAISL